MRSTLSLLLLVLAQAALLAQTTRTVYFDADTANEVDDLYAIVRAFAEPDWDIKALGSAQWQLSQNANGNTMEDSQKLNERLVQLMGRSKDVYLPRGGHRRLYDWGEQAIYSAASHAIIQLAKGMPAGEKLTVITVGALTNVASAVLIDPSISDKIEVYWLGSTYDFEKERLGFTEFNVVMDVQAVNKMMASTVEMHVLPTDALYAARTSFAAAERQLGGKGPLADMLLDRWRNFLDPDTEDRILWDLALVEILADPSLASERRVKGVDNPNVRYFYDVKVGEMMERSLGRLEGYLGGLGR